MCSIFELYKYIIIIILVGTDTPEFDTNWEPRLDDVSNQYSILANVCKTYACVRAYIDVPPITYRPLT